MAGLSESRCEVLLLLREVLLHGPQREQAVGALQQPAGRHVPLVALVQAGVLRAQVGHLLLQLLDAPPLPLQQLLLGVDDPVQLLQIFRSPRRVLGRVFHPALVLVPAARQKHPEVVPRRPRLRLSAKNQLDAPFPPRHSVKSMRGDQSNSQIHVPAFPSATQGKKAGLLITHRRECQHA